MHWKTWLFARRMKKSEERFDQITDFPAHRAKRVALQQSELGPRLFGTIPSDVSEDTLSVAGRRALIHRPIDVQGSLPAVVNFHGGGWVQGNPEQVRWLASEVASGTGAVVVSPTYRLAPEHPYPAAVEDAWDALTWVVEHAAELGIDPNRIAVMGDSAGGNLAAAVTLMARDAGGPAIRAQVLNYPVTDMVTV
jgi:acetyl esterase